MILRALHRHTPSIIPMRCGIGFSMPDTPGCESINHANLYRNIFGMLREYSLVEGANMRTFGRPACKIAYLAGTIGSGQRVIPPRIMARGRIVNCQYKEG